MDDPSRELVEAVRAGDGDRVARLLEAGADPDATDLFCGATPLHRAAHDDATIPIAGLLIRHGADVNALTQNTGSSPLGGAAISGARRMVEFLIRHGARLSPSEWPTELPAHVLAHGERAIYDLLIQRDDVHFESRR